MNVKNIFANRLKQIRKKRGLTQEQFAELINVAPRHVSFIETGRSFPSADLLDRICENLNIECSKLFETDKELTKEEIITRFLTKINKLNPEQLRFLLTIAQELE